MGVNKLYCPPNVSLSDIWINNGTSECFMDTVSTSIIFGFLFLFGSIQLGMYRKYGTEVSSNQLPRSKLYTLQILCTLLIPIIDLIKFILQATLFDDHEIYIYMIVSLILTLFIYPYSILIMHTERKYLLPSVPTRGHGLVLLIFWTLVFMSENLLFINLGQKQWWFHLGSLKDQIEMAFFVLRYISCLVIFVLGLKAPGIMQNVDYFSLNDSTSDTRLILGNFRLVDIFFGIDTLVFLLLLHYTVIIGVKIMVSVVINSMDSFYTLPGKKTNLLNVIQIGRNDNASTFSNVCKKIKVLSPFLWPKKEPILQCKVLICFLLLMAGRVVNLYVPIYNKKIVDSLTVTGSIGELIFRWDWILLYVGFKFLQGGGTGGMGLLNNLRSYLWIKIQQYTTREIELELFRHLHSLSLRWHLHRKSGEVLRVMDRGTDSINNLLNNIIFSIFPTFVDIFVAIFYFVTMFNAWFGLIVFVTMFLYILTTILVTEWRTKYQRRMNLADNAANARSVDSLLNFETVKYYGAEQFEVDSYRAAILNYQDEQWKSMITLNILNTIQNVIISGGLLTGSLLCAYMVVTKDELTVGDYVLFATYIIQLYVPLNWFGTYYRVIQKNFVDMENMFDLLRENQEVIDAPGAGPLVIKKGAIEFNNITFSYQPERIVLKNVTFAVPQGKTVALVGPSGSGKSTIIRLLFRFYDVESGSILIDGQNIKTVTQESLRRAIGVVPQDTVLFNNTIKYNIWYGRIDATDAEVIEASKNADIHEKILTFPDGYDTQVGERGLRLSGGEKQRVAIARTLLKAPSIILLDEATSALDTQTERNIQGALNRVCSNRTTLIVAHRLSTIIHADEILVLREGEIVERGRHEDLVDFGGVYADMWKKQLENNDAPSSAEQSGEFSSSTKEKI